MTVNMPIGGNGFRVVVLFDRSSKEGEAPRNGGKGSGQGALSRLIDLSPSSKLIERPGAQY